MSSLIVLLRLRTQSAHASICLVLPRAGGSGVERFGQRTAKMEVCRETIFLLFARRKEILWLAVIVTA